MIYVYNTYIYIYKYVYIYTHTICTSYIRVLVQTMLKHQIFQHQSFRFHHVAPQASLLQCVYGNEGFGADDLTLPGAAKESRDELPCQEGMQGRMLPCNRRVDENEFCAVCQKTTKAVFFLVDFLRDRFPLQVCDRLHLVSICAASSKMQRPQRFLMEDSHGCLWFSHLFDGNSEIMISFWFFCGTQTGSNKSHPTVFLNKASSNCWVTAFHPAAERVLSLTAQEVHLPWMNYEKKGKLM